MRPDTSPRFFGMDVAALRRDCLVAWRGMGRWPVISWMWPRSDIGVLQPDGALVLSRDLQTAPTLDERRAAGARYGAVVLPEEMVLRRTLQLPKLQADDLHAALWMEVQAISPFAAEDLKWTYQSGPSLGNSQSVQVALASHKLIAKYLGEVQDKAVTAQPEVWVSSGVGPGFALITGYGESARIKRGSAWGWAVAALMVLVLGLLVAMAVTPSAQLYLRTLDADRALKELQKQAEPVLTQRESLLRSTEQLAEAQRIVGKPLPPLQILQLVTDALPDDTSLTTLQVQGLKVNMTGQTANAASLMKQLGNFPGLRDVRAPTPAVKPLGAPKETFTIEFSIEPALLKPAVPLEAIPVATETAPSTAAVLQANAASAPVSASAVAPVPAASAAMAASSGVKP